VHSVFDGNEERLYGNISLVSFVLKKLNKRKCVIVASLFGKTL
jgi:hypothetical protein